MEEETGRLFSELLKKDINSIAANTSSEIVGNSGIKLDFFNGKVLVDLSKKEIFYLGENNTGRKMGEGIVDEDSSLLILHYLLNADGAPIEGSWLSFRELPGGLFYWQKIPGVLEPLKEKYGSDGNGFLSKSIAIGGVKYNKFKFASIIYPFKMIPVLMIIDEKSSEFDSDVRVLFDKSASHYMETYGVKLLVISVVGKLCG